MNDIDTIDPEVETEEVPAEEVPAEEVEVVEAETPPVFTVDFEDALDEVDDFLLNNEEAAHTYVQVIDALVAAIGEVTGIDEELLVTDEPTVQLLNALAVNVATEHFRREANVAARDAALAADKEAMKAFLEALGIQFDEVTGEPVFDLGDDDDDLGW